MSEILNSGWSSIMRGGVTSECTALTRLNIGRFGGVSDVGFSHAPAPTYYLSLSILDIGLVAEVNPSQSIALIIFERRGQIKARVIPSAERVWN